MTEVEGSGPVEPQAEPSAGDLLNDARVAFHSAEFAQAEVCAFRALELIRDEGRGETLDEAEVLTWYGAALAQQSRYQDALVQLQEAVAVYEANERRELSGRALNYIAVVHEELGDIDTAFLLYEEAVDASRAAGEVELEARILANIGEARVNLKQYETALIYLSRSATLFTQLGEHQSLLGWVLLALARIYLEIDEIPLAHEILVRALDAAVQGDSLRVIAEINTALGMLYLENGQGVEALQHLEQALESAKETGVRREIFKTRRALADAHETLGNVEKALFHFKEYHRERFIVMDELAKEKIESLTAERDLVRVRHQQEVDHIRSVELGQANDELERANRELERGRERLEAQAEELERLSVHDSLTGVHNRRYLDKRMAEEFDRALRHGHPIAVAIIDVDHFKLVNDRFSHMVGDDALRALARIMSGVTRSSDLLARYGGEEFVIVMPQINLDDAGVACEKLRSTVESWDWPEVHPELALTVSIGVASTDGREPPQDVLARADKKLYEAKEGGRNQVQF